ncbi:jg27890 [Pararge aegeria aegeria]|uniref:Jg27890 protein n=1 Tax=Pararge aegeria aegeria TaxID=348720 RepID=A0A8S4RXW1_9NEOP|nr:jg27890 [Pararge aegeria aegeria]
MVVFNIKSSSYFKNTQTAIGVAATFPGVTVSSKSVILRDRPGGTTCYARKSCPKLVRKLIRQSSLAPVAARRIFIPSPMLNSCKTLLLKN